MKPPNKQSVVKFISIKVFVFILASTSAATIPYNIPEILVAGDSWANFLCGDRGYQKTFDELNLKNLKENSDCKSTSKNGLEAGEWMGTEQHQKLLDKIHPGSLIKYVHLSIGGNDLIARWNVQFSSEQETELFERNFTHIKTIIESLLTKNPNVVVILSGYDYPRFTENHPIVEFRKALQKMGNPTPEQLNSGLIRYHQYLARRFMSHEAYLKNIFVIHHLGMQHYYDGIKDGGIGPGQTLPPDDIASLVAPESIGGDWKFMSNEKSMKKWFAGIYDAFHLGETGNKRLAEHVYRNIIRFQ